MASDFEEAVQKARKLELDGIEFYEKLAQNCPSPAGRQMFSSFASDEKRHLRVVKQLAEGLGADMSEYPMPRESIRTLFTEAAGELGDYAEATDDEKDAVEVALGMETESYKLYTNSADNAEDDKARELFERLAREENQHYEMLENTLEYLNANQEWFLWKEGALVVGDRTSLGMD